MTNMSCLLKWKLISFHELTIFSSKFIYEYVKYVKRNIESYDKYRNKFALMVPKKLIFDFVLDDVPQTS